MKKMTKCALDWTLQFGDEQDLILMILTLKQPFGVDAETSIYLEVGSESRVGCQNLSNSFMSQQLSLTLVNKDLSLPQAEISKTDYILITTR